MTALAAGDKPEPKKAPAKKTAAKKAAPAGPKAPEGLAETGNYPTELPQDDLRQGPGTSWWGEPTGLPAEEPATVFIDPDIPAIEGEGA